MQNSLHRQGLRESTSKLQRANGPWAEEERTWGWGEVKLLLHNIWGQHWVAGLMVHFFEVPTLILPFHGLTLAFWNKEWVYWYTVPFLCSGITSGCLRMHQTVYPGLTLTLKTTLGGKRWGQSIIPNSMHKTNISLFITSFVKSLLSSSGLPVSGKQHEKKTRQTILQRLCPSL